MFDIQSQTPKRSKEIDPSLSALLTLTHRTNNDDWRIQRGIMRPLLAISREKKQYSSKTTNLLRICSNVGCVTLPLCCHLKRVGLPIAIIFYA